MNNKKTSMWRLFSGLALVVAIGITSCAKDGEIGPKGENGAQGPQGTPGAQGPAGPAGAPGAPGTANVIYSTWQDVTYQGVDASSPADGTIDFYAANISAPKLVDSILQRGDIKVYMNFGTATQPQIISLPFQDLITPIFSLNTIRLEAGGNFSTATQSGAKIRQVRYILIPGGTTGRSSVNWNDYAQVKAYLNLKD